MTTLPLYPTPTRLALLRGIGRGEVAGYPRDGTDEADFYWGLPLGGAAMVTARVEAFLRVDPPWVERGDAHFDSPTSPFSVRLSDAGRKVLEAIRA